MSKKGKNRFKLISFILLLIIGIGSYWGYKNFFKSNVHLEQGKKYTYIYIHTGAKFQDLLDELYQENIINDHESFEWTARKMGLAEKLNPGKYRVGEGMSNRSLIKMILNGKQEKVKLFFNSQIKNKEGFIDYVSDKLEIDREELENYLNDDAQLEKEYGLDSENMMCLIVPQSFELNWNTSIHELFKSIKTAYENRWNNKRISKSKNIGFSPVEITILASIVQAESGIKSEQTKIAGVYINRLKQDMRLQADPTLVFANGTFDVQRVLKTDKDIDSPYNTYKYKGLPPGPISLVSDQAIDAVLSYEKHNYTYFCAKPDFSGYSCYTNDYNIHQKNAQAYQEALNKRGIKR